MEDHDSQVSHYRRRESQTWKRKKLQCVLCVLDWNYSGWCEYRDIETHVCMCVHIHAKICVCTHLYVPQLCPLRGPVAMSHLVSGPRYLNTVLHLKGSWEKWLLPGLRHGQCNMGLQPLPVPESNEGFTDPWGISEGHRVSLNGNPNLGQSQTI